MEERIECLSVLGVQGVLTLASLVFCIYKVKKFKSCNCKSKSKDVRFYSPINDENIESEEADKIKSATARVRLPKKKKTIKSSGDLSIVDTLKVVLEDSPRLLSKDLKKVVKKSIKDEMTDEQCISALSYEFVGVYGSEKIQQADVELICTLFSNSVNAEYKGYVEFLVMLKNIDKILIKAFEPKMMLLSLLLVTSDPGDKIDEKGLFKVSKGNGLKPNSLISSVTAISISKGSMEINEDDIKEALETIKAAIVRRSSRIRKVNK